MDFKEVHFVALNLATQQEREVIKKLVSHRSLSQAGEAYQIEVPLIQRWIQKYAFL